MNKVAFMKKILLLAMGLTAIGAEAMAIEKLYKDKGYVIYKCTGRGTGGQAKVRKLGDGSWLIWGGVRQGKITGPSTYEEAARVACGEDKG